MLAAGTMALLLFAWMLTIPPLRRYPDREPIHFWHMWTGEWKVIVDDICTAFNESQDTYEVIPLSIPRQVADSKFLLAVAGGAPPDCMAQWNQVLPQFAESRLIMPLDEIMAPDELLAFQRQTYPIARQIADYQGRPYCVPLALDVRACYYRLDHLRKAGLLPASAPRKVATQEEAATIAALLPQSLEELTEWGSALHIYDKEGRMVRLGFLPERLRMFASVFGGGLYDRNQGRLTLNTPQNLRALSYLGDYRNAVGYDRVQRFASALAGDDGPELPFITGKISIMIDGQWRIPQMQRFAPDIPYATAPIPPPRDGGRPLAGWVHGNFMIIPVGAKNPAGAWAFIKFWTGRDDPARAADFYVRAGWLPPSPQVANTAHYRDFVREHPQFQPFIDTLSSPNIEASPPVPFQILLFDLLKRMEGSVMRGSTSPAEALEKLEQEVGEVERRRRELVHEE